LLKEKQEKEKQEKKKQEKEKQEKEKQEKEKQEKEKQEKEKQEKHLQALETAIKSMRNTECWGHKSHAVNFSWPPAQDLLQMLKSTPSIKVKDLKYKKRSNNNSWFGGFQLILSNGTSSPVFLASGQDATNLQSFGVADYSVVKKIKGSYNSNDLSKLNFAKRDGSEIAKVELCDLPYGPESVLDDDEEIIGIFGTQQDRTYFN
jgi:hypothetical protein